MTLPPKTSVQQVPLSLPRRERQCLELLAAGSRIGQIELELGIARKTIDATLSNARRRLGAVTNEQAIAIAITRRLIIV